jgi:ferredoxin
MRIRVDTEKCSGHARCLALAPEVYDLDDLGYNVTPVKDVALEFAEAARKGAEACPEQAIMIEAG